MCRCSVAYRNTDEERKTIESVPTTESGSAPIREASESVRATLLPGTAQTICTRSDLGRKWMFQLRATSKAGTTELTPHDERGLSERSSSNEQCISRGSCESKFTS
mmetsp:Transcript_24636/g.58464  ORF Transcript_24636/g.58464 Transcript_24636/m.58464 type:complete len:106 (-) Transcript_24636:370-687(-)